MKQFDEENDIGTGRRSRSDEPPSLTYLGAQAQALTSIAIASIAIGWKPYRPTPPKAQCRMWEPGIAPAGTKPARFSRKHPDLWFAFPELPVRKLPPMRQSSARYWLGRVQSGLMARTMRTTGDLEFKGVMSCELDPSVSALIEQPLTLTYWEGGKARRYTPDLYLEYGLSRGFVEFKYEEHASRGREEELFVAKGLALAAAGYSYKVLTERHLSADPIAPNVELIRRLRHERADAQQVTAVRAHLREAGTATVTEIRAKAGITFGQVAYLVRHCVLGADLWNVPLDDTTELALRTCGHPRKPDGRQLPPGLRR